MSSGTALTRARRRFKRLRWLVLHPTAKLATLSLSQWRHLFHAQFALLAAQALVWMRPLGRLVDSAPSDPLAGSSAASVGEVSAAATPPLGDLPVQLALGVRRAAAYGVFRPLCLVRSVALNRMLERHGIHGSRIRVGVRLVDGSFAAHAWVEYQGHVLGDEVEHVSNFADLSDVRVMKWV